MKRSTRWLLTLAPQVLVLAGLVAREEVSLRTGAEIVLEVRPFDPVDAFSGRYLGVPLAIEQIPALSIEHPAPPLAQGSDVWIALEQHGTYWQAQALVTNERDRPAVVPGAVWLRGRMSETWTGTLAWDSTQADETIGVAYELTRFYIPESAADPTVGPIGAGSRRRELALVVRVAASGRASIVDLLVDGQPFAEWERAQH